MEMASMSLRGSKPIFIKRLLNIALVEADPDIKYMEILSHSGKEHIMRLSFTRDRRNGMQPGVWVSW